MNCLPSPPRLAPLSFSPPRHIPAAAASCSAAPSLLRRHRRHDLLLSPLPCPSPCGGSSIEEPRWMTLRRGFPPLALRAVPVSLPGVDGAVLQDAGATAVVLAGSYALVSVFDSLTDRGLIEQSLSRKLVHILSGILFMVSWPMFSTSVGARYFASFTPLVNCLRLAINGLSLASDEGLVRSVTREGNPRELLRGPFYYVLVLISCCLCFWRDSPVGVISLAMMCGGDGLADIMGRRYGTLKIPYNQKKSYAGCLSMFAFGFLLSVGMLYYFSVLGYMELNWGWTAGRVALVAAVATIVESLPINEVVDDNTSVPLASIVMASLAFSR